MAMRRGQHTSRVLKALGTPNGDADKSKLSVDPATLPAIEALPNEFDEYEDER
jgi:acetolactate synthase I/III small subunit